MPNAIHTDAVVTEVLRRKKLHRRFLTKALTGLEPDESLEAERYLEFMGAEGLSHEQIADAYITIVDDTFREELQFRQTGRYRYSTYAEVQSGVYDNPGYMRNYMIGLALSSFWWPNHTQIRRFFKAQLPRLSSHRGLYREVGPGHGMYFLEAMRHGHFEAYEGIDISATSIALTQRIIRGAGTEAFDRARFVHADFLAGGDLPLASVLVMGEVLEHVEDPAAFLVRAHQTTTADCSFFLTTCVNAPAIDHLYNPASVAALEDLLTGHGFAIRERCVIGRDATSVEECERTRQAINVAYLLVKPDAAP